MDYPRWVTLSSLGTFVQDYSFDIHPVNIEFSAGQNSRIILLNGSIPQGLSWRYDDTSLTIFGAADPSAFIIDARFTFRIIQTNSTVADRTFTISLTPVIIAPNWSNQETFLGYQNNVEVYSYQLEAIPPPDKHVTYKLESHPSGMTIDPLLGIVRYLANAIVTNTVVVFNVNAATSNASSLVDLSVVVLSNPTGPKWVTSSGSIGTFFSNDYIEFLLVAEDVTGATVTFSVLSSDPGFILQLSSDGLLYGRLQYVDVYTVYSFVIRAISTNGYVDRTFNIAIDISLNSDLSWNTEYDLGSVDEGHIIKLPITATSKNHKLILYNVTGGILPPNLMINNRSGELTGFCEYHTLPKTYYFDITATNQTQNITKQFTIHVNKLYGDRFMSAYIPPTGLLKNQMTVDSGNIRIREPGQITFDHMQDIPTAFKMPVISGIEMKYDTPDQIVSSIHNWLYRPDLQFGNVSNTIVDSSNTSIMYRNIVDNQNSANAVVFNGAVYNTNVHTNGFVYPISIENLRVALLQGREFISSGGGSGCNLEPIIDWSTGELLSVNIVNPGSGYLNPPDLRVLGSGTGATVQAYLGLISFQILDIGSNWQVDDEIELTGYVYNIVAVIKITAVGPNGSLSTYKIINPGNYSQVSAANSVILALGTANAIIKPVWGIVGVEILTPGVDYQCSISINSDGKEILPWYQDTYSPIIEQGIIPISTANLAANIFNFESNTMWGTIWQPAYIILQWQGVKWLGETTFDDDGTMFDGNETSFQETLDPLTTVIDETLTVFESDTTSFDYADPGEFNISQIWGGTLFDYFLTTMDLYATSYDQLRPSTMSRTTLRKMITMNNEIYSGNNAVI